VTTSGNTLSHGAPGLGGPSPGSPGTAGASGDVN
jgi:hypothetical protein